MGWADWGQLALGAYGSYTQAQAQQDAARGANGPWSEQSVNQPWGAAMPYLEGALGENQRVYQEAMRRYAGAAGGGGGGGRGGRRGGGGGGGGYQDPVSGNTVDIANRIQDRAMNGDPLMDQARGYVGNSLGAGADGPFGGNEIYNDLYGRLGGADFDRGSGLLAGFLNGSVGTQSAGYGGRSQLASGRSPLRGSSNGSMGGSYSGGGPGGGGGGRIPDTMAQGGFFADETRDLFDDRNLDPANDPTLAPYMEAIRREMGEDRDSQLAEIDDAANSIGMYGGSGRALEASRTREEAMEALGGVTAETYMGARESALARRMQALGLVSERDLAAMGDMTDRYGIDSSAAASRAASASSAGASRYATDAQRELGLRGQDLDAINAQLGHDEFGLGMLGDLGGALSSDRQWATGAASSLHGQEMDDLGQAFGSWGTIDQSRASARESAAARQAAAANQAANRSRQDALMGQSMFSDYLRGLGILTGLGPSSQQSTGQGQRGGGSSYAGPNPTSAALASTAGGLMAMYGSRQGGGNQGGGGNGGSQGYSLSGNGGTPDWWG